MRAHRTVPHAIEYPRHPAVRDYIAVNDLWRANLNAHLTTKSSESPL